jgi:hypothetical protein
LEAILVQATPLLHRPSLRVAVNTNILRVTMTVDKLKVLNLPMVATFIAFQMVIPLWVRPLLDTILVRMAI